MPVTDPEIPALIRYRNHEGHVFDRRILPRRIYYGSCKWHPSPQWLLDADDLDKGAKRTFAMEDIIAWLRPMETVGDLIDNCNHAGIQYDALAVYHDELRRWQTEAICRVGPVSYNNHDHLVIDHKVTSVFPMSRKRVDGRWTDDPVHPDAGSIPLPPPWPTGQEGPDGRD